MKIRMSEMLAVVSCCVLVLAGGGLSAGEPSDAIAPLPTPVTSFGGAVLNGRLYVYGGHTGDAHSYSTQGQSRTLSSVSLKGGSWRIESTGENLQGLAMVAYGDRLYRVGGFSAKNAEDEEHDLWSQKIVSVFDPQKRQWSAMPELPEPRSSHDAAVLGNTLYVVGGWAMAGDADSVWHKTAWSMDLSVEEPRWQALPAPPFQRRALAVAAHEGKIYAIGGMQEQGGPTTRVDVFDPRSGQWTQGPSLVGEEPITGFGASAFATGGQLYVSTIKGTLQRLSSDGKSWEIIGETPTPRFFHRMLPVDAQRMVVVGGASMKTGKFEQVEILNVATGKLEN